MISPVSILGVIILIFCYLQLFIIIIEDPYQSLFIYQISNELYMVLLLTNYAITIIDKEPLKSIGCMIILYTLILSVLVKLRKA